MSRPAGHDWTPGEQVKITVLEATVHEVCDTLINLDEEVRWLVVRHRFGKLEAELRVPLVPNSRNIEIERNAPADGVPMAGEIWADRHDNWYFARVDHNNYLVLVPERGTKEVPNNWYFWDDVHRDRDRGPIRRIARRPA